jgi:glycine cleavage system H lipoate-binding protein
VQEVESDPGLANRSPEAEGWFVKIKLNEDGEAMLQGLMQREAYDAFVAAEEH